MSGSRQVSEGGRSEKSTFVQTCNLLSRYMKEKGSLRDFNLEIGGKVESLEAIVKSSHSASASTTVHVLSDKEKSNEHAIDSDNSHKLTSKESQLTIFYSGRVLVFDECPADKAKEVIAFAKKQSSQMSYGITLGSNAPTATVTSSPREGLPPRPHKPIPQPQPKDLPIARRSSLHRFLSKRKDRAAVRGPYQYHDQVQQGPASSSSSKGDEQLELKL